MSLTTGTCAITGTPTVTALNATYTIWANISGESFSGQVWIEVGLNAPIPSYSPNSYTYTKGTAITPITASNTGGEVVSWDFDSTFPSGLNLGASNGTIWGTPDTITSTTTYTIWANNSAGSASTTITFTVNDVPPSISYSASSLSLLKGAQMSALGVTNSGGAIVSCSVSPALPNGMLLSSTCELSGTPTVAATNTSYTITATNTGGSDSASIYIEVLNSGGTLTVTPTHSTVSVNATLASIAASYSHSLTIPSWTSGVTNTSVEINNSASVAGTAIAAWDNGNLAIAWTRPIYGGTTQHVLALSTYDGSSWTTQDIDTSSRTGYRPSIAIDNQGALHIAYLDRDNTNLRYATNASGSWVLSTLDTSSVNPNNDAAKTGIAIDNRGHVHIIHPVQGSSVWVLNYTTNVSGSFVSTTITDTTKDDGKYASLAIAGNGSLHISVYRDSGGSDLRYYTDESGVWTNETVHTGSNYGKDSAIALNSKDEVVIVYRKDDAADDIYMSVGNRGSWTSSQVASNRYASYLAVAIDSNDDVHISSHNIRSHSGYCCNKDLEYFTNSSGSWVRKTLESGVGGIFGSIVIDSNDDVHISHADNIGGNDLFYATVKGSGKGLAVNPVFSVSPSLPDGLILNWKTGEITGTPTTASNNTTYTLTALALGATTTTTFTLHVTGAPGEIVYTDILGTKGVAITPVTPIISLNGTTGGISSWAINASLPTGLNFGTSNGTIWGTPTQVIAGAVFTIWANNSVGSKSTTINITINDVSVSGITYASENITLSYYHTMTTTTPTTTGGSATSWAISPTLPSGLTLNTATGAISGTPETLQTTTVTYTIWANNSGGSFSDQINITINDHAPAPINYFGENITLDYNQTITPIGDFEVKPDLIAAGEDHTCAIQSDGSVRCWGEGSYGRLGHGGSGDKNTPTATASLGAGRTAIDITAGSTHTCAVLDNGSVACWGLNNYGQLGDGTTTNRNTPTQTLSLGRPAIAVEAGSHFSTCALLDNGSVSCWGRNHKGQLGRGFTNSTADLSQRTPALTVPMPGGLPVVALDISHYMVCGVLSDGSIACWGQYGGGNTPSLQTFFNSSNPAIDVSTGRYAGCGLLENGSVTCWGTAWLGTGGESQSSNAGVIWPNLGSGRTAVQIEMGRKHRCVLLDDDSVKCWGDDQYGQLGNGAGQGSKNAPYTTSFSSNLGLQNMVSGHWHTCIASKTNEIYCWGDGSSGKQGDGSSNNNQVPGKTSHFSGANPAKAHGEITSWAIHPALPTGLSFGSTNGTLYGTPTASLAQTNFTVYANNSGGSSTFILNLGVGPAPPGPFEYIPENNTWTNNTEVNLAPQFINQTTGNGSTWQVADINSGAGNSSPGFYMDILVGDTLYFSATDGSTGSELWAHNTSNHSTWRVADIFSGSTTSWPGAYMHILVGDTIYFSADDGSTGHELWAHDTSNHSTWQVADINSGSGSSYAGSYISMLVGDTLYFGANDGSTGYELWAHNTSNLSTWRVIDLNSGSGHGYPGYSTGDAGETLVGDTLYFAGNDGSTGRELWAHNTSNHSTWQVADIYSGLSSNPGTYMMITVGDTLYFDASDGTYRHELWAHDTSNQSTWRVADINSGAGSSNPGQYMDGFLVGDTVYFSAADGSDGSELWAHDTSNHSTWQVADINTGSGHSNPGEYLTIIVGDTLYFDASDGSNSHSLWAHDTSNRSTWRVSDIAVSGHSYPDTVRRGAGELLVGDTLYFSASDGTTGDEWWAHDTSNHSTWQVADINSGAGNSAPGQHMEGFLVGDTMYFSASDGSDGRELWAHRPLSIGYNTNTGGAVTSWAINNTSLPTGLTFSTSNGTIYGTPTQLWNRTAYKVWANNSGGSSVGYLNITVVDELPTISYSPENLTLTNNTASSDLPLAPTITGSGEITSWTLNNTNLPTGLSFGSSNGTLYGTATQLWTRTSYKVWANNSGGSVEVFFNLTVNDQVPTGITYSPENVTLTNNTASSDLPLVPSITGSGAITSWTLNNTNLPTGISFGSSNGTLYGTATQLWTRTSYKVWANNSGGSVEVFFNLTVNDQVPSGITYSPENVTLTNNTASSDLPLVPSITGSGAITSWTLNNTNLPSGISFGSGNGTLYGTATQLWTRTSYKVWANNSGGSVVAYFNLTVNDQVPGISYSPENLTLTNNTASSDLPLAPTITGSGAITSWTLNNTNLPTGLSFGSSNGTLYGTATQLWTRTSYKVWANNSGGSVVAYFNLTVNDQVPSGITYSPENVTLTNNTASSDLPLVPSVTGSGAITSWTLNNTNLPSGISFGSANGTLYGTATQLWTRTSYKVWANNSGGSVVAYFNLTVNDQVPTGSHYSPENVTLTNNTASSDLPLVPSVTGSGAITSWTLNNTNLPTGISFGSANGTLYGTATQLWTRTSYKVWANNSGGSVVAYFNLTVNDQVPTGITYSPENVTLTNNTASSDLPLVPSVTGSGAITSWTLNNTNLPTGISFGSSNGTLYGTATQLWTRTSYKVWANNSGGSVVAYFNLTVNDQVPSGITYSPENVTLTNNTASSDLPLVPSVTGSGAITSWELNNTNLPTGISFGSSNGTLYGTATQLWTRTSYKVWANNSGGSVVAYFNLTVIDQVPTGITYSPENVTLTKNTASSDLPLVPSITGSGAITSWTLNNTNLPTGLSFGSSNGTLYGTATQLWTRTSYKVWANNSGGSVVAYFNLTVNDQVPSGITYSPENVTLTNNTASSDLPLVPSITGSGAITSWTLNNTNLPTGISFGSANGTLYGTATQLWTRTSYKVWANNSGGSVVAYFNLTVNDQVPSGFSYSPENLTLTNNTANSNLPLAPSISGSGAITSWAINASLPSGLSFGTNNGTIYGTPTELQNRTTYKVWANNTGGSIVAYFNLTVNDQVPTVSYSATVLLLTNNTASTDLPHAPTITGSGVITSWEINATLPSWTFVWK